MYLAAVPPELGQSTIVDHVPFDTLGEEFRGIVLTPVCDFEQNKVELVQFAAIFDAAELLRGLVEDQLQRDELVDVAGNFRLDRLNAQARADVRAQVKNKLQGIAKRKLPRYHWLQELPGGKPMVIDFQTTTALRVAQAEALPILAGLRSPYREEVASRYAAYMGRTGTPDFTEAQLEAWLDATVGEILPPE